MSKLIPTEAGMVALLDGYLGMLPTETLDAYRRDFADRGWQDALDVVDDQLILRWIAAHPDTVVGIVAA
jgi:hypothetical protein